MLKILLKFNDVVLKTFQIDKEDITIGRDVENDIQIDNLAVSGHHARISEHRSRYYIEDLNSTNGTYINEKRITTGALKDNDAVTIGKHTLVIHIEHQKHKRHGLNIKEMDSTMELDTKRHREMLKKEKQ